MADNIDIVQVETSDSDSQGSPVKQKCAYGTCQVMTKYPEGFCGRHRYRVLTCVTCDAIKKNGERCGLLCQEGFPKNLCKVHKQNITPNKCQYLGQKIGLCNKPCKGVYCGVHNPKMIELRRKTCLEHVRKERSKLKEITAKYDELLNNKPIVDQTQI